MIRGRSCSPVFRSFYLFVSAYLLFMLSSCTAGDPALLERQDLFELRLGRTEAGLDIFHINGIKSPRKNRIFMRNGIFYIANGNANKIMEFSSYGDLLGLIYNPDQNPRPVLAGTDAAPGRISNKRTTSYAFQRLGEIAVTRSGMILAEDRIPEAQRVFDEKLGASLSYLLLRFDAAGQYLDYIGQEGPGGAPFPYFESLHVTANDEIVVVCRTTTQWIVYWFAASGKRKYVVYINDDSLPVPAEGGFIPSLKTIRPDPEFPIMYLNLDFYRNAASVAQFDIAPVESRMYALNLVSGKYDSWFSLPYETQPLVGGGDFEPATVQSLHTFLGVTVGGRFFFTHRSGQDRHILTVIGRDGRVESKRLLRIEDSLLVDVNYHVSFDGVISGLYGFEDHGLVAWWRADGPGQSMNSLSPAIGE